MVKNSMWGTSIGGKGSVFDFSSGRKSSGGLGLDFDTQKKKRKTMTPAQRVWIWEHPKICGRTCNICHKKITKLSDLEFDHTKAFSKGGTKLALAHKDCNRVKSSGSLRSIQKKLGIKIKKSPSSKKHKRKATKRSGFVNPITGRTERPIKWW
jgi:hypothetical protein